MKWNGLPAPVRQGFTYDINFRFRHTEIVLWIISTEESVWT